MATLENSIAIRGLVCPDSTKGFDPEVLATTASDKEKLSERWNAIVDQPLIEWGQNPSCDDEDGLVMPSGKSIAEACKLVKHMRDQDWPLPTDVIADGEGGIVFENKNDPIYQCVEIDALGQMILFTFKNCKLISEEPVASVY